MKLYIIYLLRGKVVDISAFSAGEADNCTAQYKRDKLRLELYATHLPFDDIQLFTDIT